MTGFNSILLVIFAVFLTACGGTSESSVNESFSVGEDTYSCTGQIAVLECALENLGDPTVEEQIEACLDAGCSCSGPTCS